VFCRPNSSQRQRSFWFHKKTGNIFISWPTVSFWRAQLCGISWVYIFLFILSKILTYAVIHQVCVASVSVSVRTLEYTAVHISHALCFPVCCRQKVYLGDNYTVRREETHRSFAWFLLSSHGVSCFIGWTYLVFENIQPSFNSLLNEKPAWKMSFRNTCRPWFQTCLNYD
jgi:hypothetical protein